MDGLPERNGNADCGDGKDEKHHECAGYQFGKTDRDCGTDSDYKDCDTQQRQGVRNYSTFRKQSLVWILFRSGFLHRLLVIMIQSLDRQPLARKAYADGHYEHQICEGNHHVVGVQ